ncbi:MAG TPA: alpha/beta hydrolase [Steroidobacteraceae bacterium]
MKSTFFAGLALALSLLAPAFSAPAKFEVGALQVEQTGKSEPAVILIPGLACGPWVWRDTAARLAKDHAVYLLTLPGFDGRAPQAGVTLETLQGDLLALIESKHIRKPVIAGHSLGGTLALGFATRHSSSIAGVIAVDGLPVFPGTERMTGDRRPLGEQMRAQIGGQTREQFVLGQQAYMKQIGSIDEAVAKMLAEQSSRSDTGATADFGAQMMMVDLRAQLPQIKVPVVEISPFNAPDFAAMNVDEAGKTAYYRALLTGVGKLEVVSISPARHFVMFDQPAKFAEALDHALASMAEPLR